MKWGRHSLPDTKQISKKSKPNIENSKLKFTFGVLICLVVVSKFSDLLDLCNQVLSMLTWCSRLLSSSAISNTIKSGLNPRLKERLRSSSLPVTSSQCSGSYLHPANSSSSTDIPYWSSPSLNYENKSSAHLFTPQVTRFSLNISQSTCELQEYSDPLLQCDNPKTERRRRRAV